MPRFPPIDSADEDGLLFVGGQLTPDWLLEAYRRGIFPWPFFADGREHLGWFSPDPRAIIELDSLHVSRRLRQRMRSAGFTYTLDSGFAAVIAACAAPRGSADRQSWITPRLAAAYVRLHELGMAHSIEVWQQGRLVGGLYGVAIGGIFAGESMFHRVSDASKAALVWLLEHLRDRGYVLFDIQQHSPHAESMGATEIPRHEFLRRLQAAIEMPVSFGA